MPKKRQINSQRKLPDHQNEKADRSELCDYLQQHYSCFHNLVPSCVDSAYRCSKNQMCVVLWLIGDVEHFRLI